MAGGFSTSPYLIFNDTNNRLCPGKYTIKFFSSFFGKGICNIKMPKHQQQWTPKMHQHRSVNSISNVLQPRNSKLFLKKKRVNN